MIKITDKIASIIPKHEFNGGRGEKLINWFGKNISTPQNRIIVGVTALMSQPFIDLYNKKVDEKTRKASCARTIGKNIAGMITGFSVRAGFIKLTQKYSELGDVGNKKMKKFFTPSNANPNMPYAYKQYQNAMGMLLAIVGLLFTGFLIDAPLTNVITNAITKKMGGSDNEKH